MIRFIQYAPQKYRCETHEIPETVLSRLDRSAINWLDIDIGAECTWINQLADHFHLHVTLQDDILHHRHLPKSEIFDDHLFMTLKMLRLDRETMQVSVEQVSMVLGGNYLLTFQEELQGDVFDEVRYRIEHAMGKVRQAGADYLFCRLMGVVVDHYVEILEFFREKIDELEDIVLGHPQEKNVKQIARLKKEVNRVRRYIFPLAAEVARLMSDGDPWIQRATHTYLRNIYDHVQTVYAGMENLGDRLKDLMDLHLSRISHDMNRVMKTLTVVTTIFIPLTFLAGIYGMNFRYMPELEQPWGYPALLLLMLGIAAGMSIWMWRKKWF